MIRHSINALVSLSLYFLLATPVRAGSEIKGSTPLAFGISSNISYEEARWLPQTVQKAWKIIENSKLDPSDKRPRFDKLTVSIPEYIANGFKGELRLQFFNNRLMNIWFFPADFPAFKAFAEKSINFNKKGEAFVLPRTKIWFGKTVGKGEYIGWEDAEIAKEEMDWIYKYS